MPALFHKRKSRSNRGAYRATGKLDASIQFLQNRAVKEGYPIEVPFNSPEKAMEYLNQSEIICLRCGKAYKVLNSHLIRIHEWQVRAYQEFYCLPTTIGLASPSYRQHQAEKAIERNAIGLLKPGRNGFNDNVAKAKSAYKSMTAKQNINRGRLIKLGLI